MDCDGNRTGRYCERCLPYHFLSSNKDEYGRIPCKPCNCNPIGKKFVTEVDLIILLIIYSGSENMQCSSNGKCVCKPGVDGDKCNKCKANHWNFGLQGCESMIFTYIGQGDRVRVESLIAQGIDLNSKNGNDETVFDVANRIGNTVVDKSQTYTPILHCKIPI